MTARRVMMTIGVVAALGHGASAEPQYSHLRIVAPAAPGGGWDQTARALQHVLQSTGIATGVSVENIPGAAGTIGLARLVDVERGSGDVVMVSGLIMLAAIVARQSPVTLRDATPIARLTGEYEVLVVPARSPYRTLEELLSAFRAHPESIAWAGGSAGGADQMLAAMIADAAGVPPRRVNYVPFAGGGESMGAILGGQVTVGISGVSEYAAQIAAGNVRAVAVSSPDRLPAVDAPTLREEGLDVVLENWRSLVAPPGTRAEDRARLERAVAAAVQSPAWQEALRRFGWSDRYLAADDFARFMADEDARVQAILAKLGTTADASPATTGAYPLFVLIGLMVAAGAFALTIVRGSQHTTPAESGAVPAFDGSRSHVRAIMWIGAALTANVLLMERAGFVLAAIPLYWSTARAFDASHPIRDLVVAVVLATAAFVVFARLLQIALPAGVLAGWI